ncbi:hypothetical protein NMY3_02416 [Candidatus Nitrosocosmicus oleophilus]|uniref:Uncharacterized protein n=1 Tax=Candidatus Nitrosocosmicus oleophilus TaxID=1353260 RepID=A0A654MAV9_9ARCH|nr:hypothetical protein NMY3_02416 [Candidatus Nitrosocosmicus oleophilus]
MLLKLAMKGSHFLSGLHYNYKMCLRFVLVLSKVFLAFDKTKNYQLHSWQTAVIDYCRIITVYFDSDLPSFYSSNTLISLTYSN